MKKLLALLLALCLIGSLCACELPGKKTPEKPEPTNTPEESATPTEKPEETEAPDPNLGKYALIACMVDDVYIDAADFSYGDESCVVELRKNGRANLYEGSDKTSAKYQIDGDEITITADEDTLQGTIADGLILIEAPEEDGIVVTMVFAKEDRDNADLNICSMDEYLAGHSGGMSSGTSGIDISGSSANCGVRILGTEPFYDCDDEPALYIYYAFTNLSEETTSASNALTIDAYQDNCALEETYALEDLAEEYNCFYDQRPGVTIHCVCSYRYDPKGGPIRLIMKDWWEEEPVIDINLDPAALPAAPATWEGPEPIYDPLWTEDLEWEGVLDNFYVYVDSAEALEDDYGNICLRVYYEITNESDAAEYASSLIYQAFQDGMELEIAYAYEETDTDEALYSEIEAGCTAVVSKVFVLRSDNAIEVEVYSYWSDDPHVGGVFE